MMTPDALKRIQVGITSTAARAYALMLSGQEKMTAIRGDQTRTKEWQVEQLAPIKAAPEIRALLTQGNLAYAAFADELKPWRQPMTVLRFLARPTLGAGQDEHLRWSTALAEVAALANDPAGLQEVLSVAVHERDWRMVYAILMGRVHSLTGRPVNTSGPFFGVPLPSLDLPGIEEIEDTARQADLSKADLDYVAFNLESWNGTAASVWKAREDGSVTNVGMESRRIIITRQYDEAKAQRMRLQAAKTPLEAWKIFKETRGIPDTEAEQEFDTQLERITAATVKK